jgi:cephalosporin hydroxylase
MPFKNTKEQLRVYKSDYFIETGTNSGGAAIIASSIFKNVITIEIDENKYNKYIELFKSYNNIQSFLGDSALVLPKILSNINDDESITFWLDAHISFDANSGLCPLYEELEIIKQLNRSDCTILIDDVRVLKKEKYGWGKLVNLDNTIKKILDINPKYTISYIDGFFEKDILVAKI